jgi:hypothetical protein
MTREESMWFPGIVGSRRLGRRAQQFRIDMALILSAKSHNINKIRHVCVRARADGGADRIQTGDLLVANEALYQLSYCPGQEGLHLGRCVLVSKSLFSWAMHRDRHRVIS